MGKAVPAKKAADDVAAEKLLSSFQHISARERRRHATIFNYWLAIRGNRQFPSIRDLDPLEISDAAPSSVLLEMIGGGEDADIRHLGSAVQAGEELAKISQAPAGSLLACIAGRLPELAATMQAISFEESVDAEGGPTRCWVTLLPFSSTGTWIDFAYGLVSLDTAPNQVDPNAPVAAGPVEEVVEPGPVEQAPAITPDAVEPPGAGSGSEPTFSRKIFEALAGVGGFYGTHVKVDPILPPAPEPEETVTATHCPVERPMQNRLAEVRAKADEARLAKLRSNLALYEGLGAAYDFALDAEDAPEDYLKLVAAEGLKIQLRSPMAPVVKLAFNGLCDDSHIPQLEAVLAWALKRDFPRGTLARQIEAEGGIDAILSGSAASS